WEWLQRKNRPRVAQASVLNGAGAVGGDLPCFLSSANRSNLSATSISSRRTLSLWQTAATCRHSKAMSLRCSTGDGRRVSPAGFEVLGGVSEGGFMSARREIP